MERRTALAIGALAVVGGLVVLTGVAFAAGSPFASHSAQNSGMMGRGAGYSGGMMGGYSGSMMGGNSGSMMGSCGGANWNGTSCYSNMERCQGSDNVP